MKMKHCNVWLLLLFLLGCFGGLEGCVSTPAVSEKKDPVFFPQAPSLPRYQFLRSFNGSVDFEAKAEGLSAFLGVSGKEGFVLKKPYGVLMSHGSLYAADSMNGVFRFDLKKKTFTAMQGAKGLGKLVQPVNMATDQAGNKFVCDPVRGQVVGFDKNDFYFKAYSSSEQWKPVAAAVYEDRLFVVDGTRNSGAVRVFNIKSGEMVEVIGRDGAPETQLRIPTNIAFDSEGYMYVVDAGRFQVVKYDRDGHYRGYIGGPGSSFGFFGRPKGIAVDRDGRIYVADAAYNHVQVFSANGQVLTSFGSIPMELPGSISLPAGIWIDYDSTDLFKEYIAPGFEVEYIVIVANQFHPTSAINVYGFGRMSGQRYPGDEELREKRQEELIRQEGQ